MKKNDEEYIQIYIASFLRKLQAIPGVDFLFFHVPNGGNRSKSEGSRFKMMGVLPGVSDLCVMGAGKMFFIELKKDSGTLSAPQKDFIKKSSGYGFPVHVVYAQDPADGVKKCGQIMKDEFSIDQNLIEKSSSSATSSIA